ncbi:LysR family transcriptional regulator [Clostridium sp. D2Q-14]|uniref:selenium metabolism-associated LysR family transcriptional regulator n=1 Tax=Anaeromonas gelatinilytica TaxID=2683194 RepID=UPI00193BF91E|nr:selenium metabolism-associated LysR family transcriptional regulator [Anaeromonas gelatinilytica]MBS4535196.1 LysR family transcriptional regulator [Anaeromonas gelatinilytica]
MDFRQLETFVEVINSKSFSKAANKLFLTQPTVTSHIQNLEKELNISLLNRSNKNISPTSGGKILYNYAQDIINMRDMAQFKLGKYKGQIEGTLEIASSTIPKQYILPHILKSFFSKYPNITLNILHNNSKGVINDIMDNRIDFGIVGAKYNNRHLKYIELIEDNLILIAPKNNNLSNSKKLTIDLVRKENMILRHQGSGSRLLLEKALHDINDSIKSFNVVITTESNETIKKFVELGIGVSFISELAVKKELENDVFKGYNIPELNLNRKFYFVYHENRYLSPLAETFKNFVTNWINKRVEL